MLAQPLKFDNGPNSGYIGITCSRLLNWRLQTANELSRLLRGDEMAHAMIAMLLALLLIILRRN